MFGESYPILHHHWKPIILHLIRLGTDLQQGSEPKITLLDDLMNALDSPFESRSLGKEWLDILLESGVCVTDYLRIEHRLHFEPFWSLPVMQGDYETNFCHRYLIISEETPSISWDWLIDPDGEAFDVLEEFKNFGLGYPSLWDDFCSPEHTYNWPFFYPRWHYCMQIRDVDQYKNLLAIHEQAENRFQRRWNKKTMKLAKAQGIIYRGPKIPGAWID
jgi:hypothetical protein